MTRLTPLRALSSAVLLALLVSAIHPLPAFAEEGAPPPDPAAPAAEAPADADPAGEAPADPAATPAPDAPAAEPAEEAPPAEAPAASDPIPAADTAPADVLADLPDGTTVAVVDAQGEAVPLVSAEAEAIAAVTDPVWCPASVKAPTPGLAGCSPPQSSMADLISWFTTPGNMPAVDGVIWIQAGPQADTGTITFDGGSTLAAMSDYRLTLRGGWDGVAGSKVITPLDVDDLTGGSTFSVPLNIFNWNADVTLTDLNIDVTSTAAALEVSQRTSGPGSAGGIYLTRMRAHGNGEGAHLGSFGANNTGRITIVSGRFNGNGDNGLYVEARGAITLTDVLALENGAVGASLNNWYNDTLHSPVTIGGGSSFNDNTFDGLYVSSGGVITAADLTASGNGVSGASLNNANASATPALGIKITGINIFTGNAASGIIATSKGAIALNSVTANANIASSGIYIYNATAASPQPVTLSGTNAAKYNGDYGLELNTRGAVTINNLTASGNAATGAYIYSTDPSDVSLTGASVFNDNGDNGLRVDAAGLIKAANLTADRNVNVGAYLNNSGASTPKSVTLTGVNAFRGNRFTNLWIESLGAVTASNLTASGSTLGTGAWITNASSTLPQKVTLSGTNVFADNSYHGLHIYASGAIAVSSLRATGNGLSLSDGYGAFLQNNYLSAQPVTLTGSTVVSHNRTYDGLFIRSLGSITAANLTAVGNHGAGAHLENTGAGGVTLTGTNVLTDNRLTNTSVSSQGVIKISSLTASRSLTGYGADIRNNGADPTAPKDILISGTSTFDDNWQTGLYLESRGAITLPGASASHNGQSGNGEGIFASNDTGSDLARPITFSGTITANDNHGYGIYLQSRGAVKANSVTASDNDIYGLYIYNINVPPGSTPGGVTLTGTSAFRSNGASGLYVLSYGAISAANLTASGNLSAYGASLTNIPAVPGAAAGNVTLSGTNVFTGNGDGLVVNSEGVVSIANLSSTWNSGYGAQIDNHNAGAPRAVTLSGTNTLSNNGLTGLVLTSLGAITINALTASDNTGGSGAWLGNDYNGTTAGVKLTGMTTLNNNQDYGLYVTSRGAISAAGLTASGTTAGYGAWLVNHGAAAVGGITLSGTNRFEDNLWGGVTAWSRGAITLNSVTASGNTSGMGANLDNHFADAGSPQPVKITGTNTFNENAGGLSVGSIGAISASNITATANTSGHGAYLGNRAAAAAGITLTGVNVLNDNLSGSGLYAESYGPITVNSVSASGNNGQGAWLDNSGAPTAQAVKLTGTNTFNDNSATGFAVASGGAITVNNVTAIGNSGSGASLNNVSGTAGVTLTGANVFIGNSAQGLSINTNGAVSLTKVTAEDNSLTGITITGAPTDVTLTCGSLTSNGTYGIYVTGATGVLKLIGVFASGNVTADVSPATGWMVTRTCPLP